MTNLATISDQDGDTLTVTTIAPGVYAARISNTDGDYMTVHLNAPQLDQLAADLAADNQNGI